MKSFLTTILILSCIPFIHSQEEATNWYFGTLAGLNFNSGAPVALTNGSLSTQEGCATISDFNGNLLFYTDGITVWNRTHIPMPNGTGLLGHPSSTQSGIIVPQPGNPDLYYVFTVDDGGEVDGLQYNIVDMTADGGLGDITLKNIPLASPVTEKLTAVTHANGTDIWVIAHAYGNNEFLSYLVTPTGINATPISSIVGSSYPVAYNGLGSRGYMKVSPNGEFLALATAGLAKLELLRFSTITGAVSDPISMDTAFPAPPFLGSNSVYGVEFSSDSSKLYATLTVSLYPTGKYSNIRQFDITAYDQTSILASTVQLAPDQNIEIGALQLAIDRKIYVAQFEQNYLGVINSPNVQGTASGYVQNGVGLGVRVSRLGLPPFIQSYFVVGILAQNFCLGDATAFEVTTSEPVLSIDWDFGDGNTSTLEDPTNTYATPGTYTVVVTVTTASEIKTESKDITIYETPTANSVIDFEICSLSPTHQFDLSTKDLEILGAQSAADNAIRYYPSMVDAQNGTNVLPNLYTIINAVETIYARISNANNPSCFDTTAFDVVVKEAPLLNVVTDWVVCDNDTDGFFDFDLTQKNAEVLNGQSASTFSASYFGSQADADNNTNAIGPSFTNTTSPQPLFFRIHNTTYPECYESGSFNLEVITAVTAQTPTDIEICDDDNDGIFTFDLRTKDGEILGGQSATSFIVKYFGSQAEADTGTNPINAINFSNTTPYGQTVFARVENNGNANCYNTTSFDVLVYNSPLVQQQTDWHICDDDNDGVQIVDLTQKDLEVLGDQSAGQYTVSYHESQTDADANTNAIIGPYQNNENPQTIYYRLENSGNAGCYVTDSFVIEVFDTPTANTPTPFIVCDTNETGMQSFDLAQKDIELLNGQSATTFEVLYFANQADADANLNALPKGAYINTNVQETIHARIQNSDMDSCYATTQFEIIVNPLPEPILEETYVICPDSPELTIDGGAFDTWSWRDENDNELGTNRTIDIGLLGDYSLTVTQTLNGIACEKSVVFEVVSSGAPEDFTTDIQGFSDRLTLEIDAIGVGELEYSVDGENFQSDSRFEIFPGEYTVYVRDRFLCRTLMKEIVALGYQKFFTPNNDGSHERWNIIGAEHFTDSRLYIYDRYGKLLEQLSPTSSGWDGTFNGRPLPSSDYWFKYNYDNGKVVTGHFTLKR